MLEGLIRRLISESRDRWERLEVSLEDIRKELGEWKLREERRKKEKEEIVGQLDKLEKKLEGRGEGKVEELDRGLEDLQRRLRKVEGKKGKLEDGGGDWMELSRRLKELEWGMEERGRIGRGIFWSGG
ncbi:axoneme-associated protein gasp-180 [Lasius niger]|uniref:Axoneme-associated protein gasp-180 n=1 Tax=Lasius niger TaxID=67767 RepID=A0A0J7KAN9_LASNI|nr:axoneme-associated protein gasp-180 [Lasius niger]